MRRPRVDALVQIAAALGHRPPDRLVQLLRMMQVQRSKSSVLSNAA